jgi:hypothetical protein
VADLTPEAKIDVFSLSIGGTDIGEHVRGMTFDGDAPDAVSTPLTGLKEASISMTLDNSGGTFAPIGGWAYPPQPPRVRVTYAVPDGRWQGVKHRLKRFWPLRWLKVRYLDYSFEGEVAPWSDMESVSVGIDGPISRATDER